MEMGYYNNQYLHYNHNYDRSIVSVASKGNPNFGFLLTKTEIPFPFYD